MLSRELKVGIIGGVISSMLVIIFVQPVLGFVWNAVISFGEYLQAGYVDRIYNNAAIGERNLGGNFSLLILGVVLLNAPLAIYRYDFSDRYQKIFSRIIIFSIMSLAIMVLVVSSLSLGIMEINASFNQRVTVLAPSIEDKELKEWKAKWAQMRSQSDYKKLVSAMEKRAIELDVSLPKLREP
ncbi:hypothetical protein [Aeromonas taiwanensis]|uniref:hypothetical protein n=1 Tax=Aeromonas taiwanensis TaxID=633417 RepID=UPI003BA3D66D